jgi:hypothetical protein
VLAITFVVGSIAAVDMRLLGLASRDRRFSRLNAEIVPLTWGAFAVALVSGFLLFSSKAVQYAANLSFDLKMLLLLLAGLNMAAFQLLTFRGVSAWCAVPHPMDRHCRVRPNHRLYDDRPGILTASIARRTHVQYYYMCNLHTVQSYIPANLRSENCSLSQGKQTT